MLLNDDTSRLIRSRVGALDMYNLTNCDMCERNRLAAMPRLVRLHYCYMWHLL